jgi:glycerol uptake facilitator-like aquaporin
MVATLCCALTLGGLLLISAHQSGGCLNPAIAVSQTILEAVTAQADDVYVTANYTWTYICATMLGGWAAGLINLMHKTVVLMLNEDHVYIFD